MVERGLRRKAKVEGVKEERVTRQSRNSERTRLGSGLKGSGPGQKEVERQEGRVLWERNAEGGKR